MVSAKTKAQQKAVKARSVETNGFSSAARQAAIACRKGKADEKAAGLASVIGDLKAAGITSPHRMAKALSERGILTARGKRGWQAVQVSRLLARLGKERSARQL
jgi:polyisoprenoid-binding protein YceI